MALQQEVDGRQVMVSEPGRGTLGSGDLHPSAERDLLEKIASRVPGIIFKFKLTPDGGSTFPYMSSAVTAMYNGITPEELRQDASPFFAFRHPDDAEALASSVLRSAQTLSPWDHEYRLILPEVGVVWRHGNALPERQADGSVAWFGFITDITERKRAENQLRIASRVFECSGEAIAVLDPLGRIQAANQALAHLSGCALADLTHAPLSRLVDFEGQALSLSELLSEVANQWQGACVGLCQGGGRYSAWLRIRSVDLSEVGEQGAVLIAVLSDRSQHRRVESRLSPQGGLDPLTGLINRRWLLERTRHAIEFASVAHHPMALVYIDLDFFKEINDMFGHPVGDQLLVEVAARLKSCAGKTDTLARMGGDEFAILLQRKEAVLAAEQVVQQFVDLLTEPFYLGGEEVFVTASIGIAEYPKDAQHVNDLLVCADRSMHQAKEEGRNKVQHFDDQMLAKVRRRRQISNALRLSLSQQQFYLVYQPIVDVRTRQVVKAEALIRWRCPKLPGVGPAEFIPVAEDLGLIEEIGEWVFQQVALVARDINLQLAAPIQISINQSARQLTSGDSSLQWLERLAELNIPPSWLGVEITETLLLDGRPSIQNTLRNLRRGGLQLSLDDFGTGYSAMSYLLRFELDYIKIDQSFVRDVVQPRGRAIVEAIVVMAHKLGLRVIAEGVEDEVVLNILQEMQCDYVQGYYFSPPLAQQDFLNWVLQRSVASTT